MRIEGSTVGIIGGSIAGCAAAIALHRAGCNVQVFERSSYALRDRGSGIAIPKPVRDKLIETKYLRPDYANCEINERWWLMPGDEPFGRMMWRQPSPGGVVNNWGVLWRSLREQVDDEIYHDGLELGTFETNRDGARVRFKNGREETFDMLVAADGYHSTIRDTLHPEAHPNYAGYVLWRGNYPESELVDRAILDAAAETDAWFTVPYPGGHGVLYMIPDFGGQTSPGSRRVNWAIYAPEPEALELDGVVSVPPGGVTPEVYSSLDQLLGEHFPSALEALIRHTPREQVSIQPIFDGVVDTYVGDRVLLIGDAGSMTRPHTGAGATKALQDAMALEELAAAHRTWDDLLPAYDAERASAAKTLCDTGQKLGYHQVTHTPDWKSMSEADFEKWSAEMLSGNNSYLFPKTGGADKRAARRATPGRL